MPLIQYQFTPFLKIEYECTANNTSYAFFKIKSSVHFLANTQTKQTDKRNNEKNLLTLKTNLHFLLNDFIPKSKRAQKQAPENNTNEQKGFFPKLFPVWVKKEHLEYIPPTRKNKSYSKE